MKTPETKRICNSKINNIAKNIMREQDEFINSSQGIRNNPGQNILKTGDSDAKSLLRDFHLRAKITNIDNKENPGRNFQKRGGRSHGHYELNTSLSKNSEAKNQKTPGSGKSAIRFGTVANLPVSSDLARELRGFTVNFYTEDGYYDLAENNIPMFFIQDTDKETVQAASKTDVPLRRTEQPETTVPSFIFLKSHEPLFMTKRESQVIELIAEGLTNKEIGNTLHLSHLTVKSHVHNIMRKMALRTRLQIAKYFYAKKEYKDSSNSINITT